MKYILPLCIFMHICAMERDTERRFQQDLTQAVEQSKTRQEAQQWIDSFKALEEYKRFFANPVTIENINALLAVRFGPERLPVGPQEQQSLLEFLPIELRQQLNYYKPFIIVQEASIADWDETIKNLRNLASTKEGALPFSNFKVVASLIDALFNKGFAWPLNLSRLNIATVLSSFAPAAQEWLKEHKQRAADEFKLIDAVEKGDLTQIRALIAQGVNSNAPYADYPPLIVGTRHYVYISPLQVALILKRLDIAKFLLNHGAHPTEGKRNWQPLLYVVSEHNDPDLVRLLLEKGANLNAKNSQGQTAFDIARGAGKDKILAILNEFKAKQEKQVTT